MEQMIESYIAYLHDVKHASQNTIQSYRRDLNKMRDYFRGNGVTDVNDVNATSLGSYVLYLEGIGMSSATVSRSIASIRSFFLYLLSQGMVQGNPTEQIKPPKVEKKAPDVLTVDEVALLLQQPSGKTPKEIRDKAMLELLYGTGLRVSELISLKLTDINLPMSYVKCDGSGGSRIIPIEEEAKKALTVYLDGTRNQMTRDSEYLFVNVKGDETSLPDITAKHLYQDQLGRMWVATYKNGVAMSSDAMTNFNRKCWGIPISPPRRSICPESWDI